MNRNALMIVVGAVCLFVGLLMGTVGGFFLGRLSSNREGSTASKGSTTKAGEIGSEIPGVQAVTAKEVETFGEKFTGTRLQMVSKFNQVSDTWVKLLLRDENYVGIMVNNSKGELFQCAFADKEKFGPSLLKMKRGDSIVLVGKVTRIGSQFVFMVDEIRR